MTVKLTGQPTPVVITLEQRGGGPNFHTDVLWDISIDGEVQQHYVASWELSTHITALLLEKMGYKADGTPDWSKRA